MKNQIAHCGVLVVIASLIVAPLAVAQNEIIWEAYNDYRPGEDTDPNASDWDLRVTDDGGPLRDIATGDDLEAEVYVEAVGNPQDFGANVAPDEGSPGDLFFRDFVQPGVEGLPGVQDGANELTLVFQNLDPSKRYNFRGLAVRGGSYDNRWSIYSIFGTDAEVVAHVDGSARQNLFTAATFPDAGIEENEVVLNSGINLEGSLVGWDNIEPGADGQFSIDAKQYVGETPYGDASTGPYAYGFAAIYLAEIRSSGDLRITENPPPTQIIADGQSATLTVVATSPETIAYQWQRSAPGDDEFEDVDGALEAIYMTPALTADDNGARYRCLLSSDDADATSGISELSVDGVIPTAAVEGSINFNAIYVTFSEAMKADQMAMMGNYQLGGGPTLDSVTVLDPFRVRIGTSAQQKNAALSLTVKDIEDLAGNKIDGGSPVEFKSFALTNGAAGLEIWLNIADDPNLQILKDYPAFPDSPDVDYVTTRIDSREVYADATQNTYGGRFRAWLIPEDTAEYEFFLRADDAGEFSISPDSQFGVLDDPNRFPDLEATGNLPFEEGIPSEPIALEAGKKYAVQVLWSEDNGDDVAQLAWRKAGDDEFPDAPIPADFFCYFGPNAPDEDNDGMSDVYETLYGLNPEVDDTAGDLDSDGLTNGEEHTIGTAANSDDTDSDGLKDGVESGTGVYVSDTDTGTSPLSADSDSDGLGDGVETRTGTFVSATDTGTDPLNRDTDGDGARDGLEVSSGFDPNDAASVPSVVRGGGAFATSHVWTDGDPEILDIFEAEDILLDPDAGGERFEAETGFIHFHDDTSEPPVFVDQSKPFPLWDDDNGGAGGFGDHDSFAVRSVGQINITQSGLITFICNSDDGFSLRIDGEEIGFAGDRGRANTVMEVDLTAGVHDLELIYYELGGGAGLSLFVYRGVGLAPDLNEAEWELLPAFGGSSSPFEISEVNIVDDKLIITWPSQPGQSFIVETAEDLDEWEEIVDGHPSGGTSTSYEIDLSGDMPAVLYVRAALE